MPKKARKILVFWKCEGFFHGDGIAGGNKCLELLGQKLGVWQADITDDFAVFTADNLAKYDAIVFNNSTNLKSLAADPAKIAAVADFVRQGKGLAGIHAVTDNGGCRELAKLMGGQFAGHPWGGGGTWAFKLEEPKHPLLAGFGGQGFKIKDEIYQFKDYYTRDDRRVLITLDLSDPATAAQKGGRDDKDYAVSWIKTEGSGRIFYCSLGHNASVFYDRRRRPPLPGRNPVGPGRPGGEVRLKAEGLKGEEGDDRFALRLFRPPSPCIPSVPFVH